MRLLKTIKPEDVDTNVAVGDYSLYTARPAARAIVFDGQKVALIFIRKHGYYMLPGGGIDEGEDVRVALHRELDEELGCETQIISEVGSITIYNDRWHTKQTDYCHIAQLVTQRSAAMPTQFEADEGHEVVWAKSLTEAIRRIRNAMPENRDGKLVRARDLLFLETAQQIRKASPSYSVAP